MVTKRSRRFIGGQDSPEMFFVAERRLSLAQPLKAGITHNQQLFVASAMVECSIVADATQIQKHSSIPALRGRTKVMPTLRVEHRCYLHNACDHQAAHVFSRDQLTRLLTISTTVNAKTF